MRRRFAMAGCAPLSLSVPYALSFSPREPAANAGRLSDEAGHPQESCNYLSRRYCAS